VKKEVSQKDLYGIVDEVAKGRISRRQFMERGLAMGLSVSAVGQVLVACGTKDDAVSGASPAPMDETKPKQVNLWNWADYMDGATKKNFEKATGIKVVESYFDDNEALLTKLRAGGNAGGYDVMVPSDYMVHVLIMSGLIEPLNMEYIPNFSGVSKQMQNPKYDNPESPENNGNRYSVPYAWGTTGYAQRIDILTDDCTKWADLWNPAFEGKISMLNDERETLGVGLMKNGYSINTQNIDELNKAKEDLIAQVPLVRMYESVSPKSNIVKGIPLTHCWCGDIVLALWSGAVTTKTVNFVMAEEGMPVFTDCLVIPKKPGSSYGAHMFMNYLLDPKVQAPLQSWIGYFTPVPAAVDQIDPVVYTFAPTEEKLAEPTTEGYEDLGEFAIEYSNAWEEVRSV